MQRNIYTLVLLLLASAAGCKGGPGSPTLQGLLAKVMPPKGSEMVAMAFDPDSPDRRREGVTLLSEREWGQKEPYLKGYAFMLKSDSHPTVRSAAARALARSSANATAYLPTVIEALDDESPFVRYDVAVALDRMIESAGQGPKGNVDPADAIGPLSRRAMEDDSADVRGPCVRVLRHFRTTGVLGTLKICLGDPSLVVRRRARQSLTAIIGRDLGDDPGSWPATLAARPK